MTSSSPPDPSCAAVLERASALWQRPLTLASSRGTHWFVRDPSGSPIADAPDPLGACLRAWAAAPNAFSSTLPPAPRSARFFRVTDTILAIFPDGTMRDGQVLDCRPPGALVVRWSDRRYTPPSRGSIFQLADARSVRLCSEITHAERLLVWADLGRPLA